MVGVNRYTEGDERDTDILRIDHELERKQIDRLTAAKRGRDERALQASLDAIRDAGAGTQNLMPLLIDAARHAATEGEIVQTLQAVWGSYREQPAF